MTIMTYAINLYATVFVEIETNKRGRVWQSVAQHHFTSSRQLQRHSGTALTSKPPSSV